jgi:hypothetical protein
VTSWVLLDESQGAKTSGGEVVTPALLALIAEVITVQMCRDYAPNCGGPAVVVRAGKSATDIQVGERVFSIMATLPDAPGDVAYHSVDGNGVPFALLAITTCDTILGAGTSVSSAVSHEVLEEEGDPGCNRYADDGLGTEHAIELCDAVETQSYAITSSGGTVAYVSDFLLDAWFIPNAPGPYSYMALARLQGAVDAPGPMKTVSSGGGNYQMIRTSPTSENQVFAKRTHKACVEGMPRNHAKVAHWSSRVSRRGARL